MADEEAVVVQRTPNLALWDAVKVTDPRWTKTFDRGTFKGTAIDPMYNAMRATARWGPYGLGWGATVTKEEIVNDEQSNSLVHQIEIDLWFHEGRETGHAVGKGATKLAYTNAAGTKRIVDEEAFKKSFTDAIGNALKWLGFSADVFLGLHDNNKYVQEASDRAAVADAALMAANGSQVRAVPEKNGEQRASSATLDEAKLKVGTELTEWGIPLDQHKSAIGKIVNTFSIVCDKDANTGEWTIETWDEICRVARERRLAGHKPPVLEEVQS